MRLTGAVLGLLVLLASAGVQAADNFGANALRGVSAIAVSAEGVARDYARYGLTAQELAERVAAQLAAAGLPVIATGATTDNPRASDLRVLVTAYEASYALVSYRIALELQRRLPLDDSGQSYVLQRVWSQGRSGLLNPSDLKRLYDDAAELGRHFIADFGAHNAGASAPQP